MQGVENTNSQPSSAGADRVTSTSSSGDLHDESRKDFVNESDEDVRRVPELGSQALAQDVNSRSVVLVKGEGEQANIALASASAAPVQRKRGRSSADKEHKRLKRLLRNRVSAQQARERKKAYLNDLENRARDLQQRNCELEERISTLQNENAMLRQILKNTTSRNKSSGNCEA
eukprot:TRINITY_DN1335_c0_g1_i1.p1 TRINITY_DN1335_c0_g1~~TRINITY_DN1335_c0_g1_i1.p1  ORF type:complete len:174 (-),score=38.33 TRINITY_DN1335_c0_g1_i1:967-1488(-)